MHESFSSPGADTGQSGPQGSAWRRRWRDFVTSGGRVDADDPDYLRVTLMNLLAASALGFCALFLVLHLFGVLTGSAARVAIEASGVLAGALLIAALRRGVPVRHCAHAANGVFFLGLLGLTFAQQGSLAVTLTLIYPAPAYLLLDSVRGGTISTALMVVGENAAILSAAAEASRPWPAVLDVSLSVTAGLSVLGAIMALHVHHRRQVMGRLRDMGEQMAELASHDPLTGLYNRRSFLETIERELARRDRDARVLALLLFDVDHFKAYNDRFGHPQGDALLKRMAAAARGVFNRREDLLFRLGGEEFGALFRAESAEAAAGMAERMLAAIEGLGAEAPDGPHRTVTISAGLSLVKPGALSAEEVYRATDDALYRAKAEGRARWMRATFGSREGPG